MLALKPTGRAPLGGLLLTLLVTAPLVLAACGDEDDRVDTGTGFAELQGTYTDDFGGTHAISADSWVSGTDTFHIQTVVEGERFLVAHNDAANAFNPDLFSRFEWADDDGGIYYCQSVFDAASEQAALESSGADVADLTAGCGGFPWTQLIPAE